MKRYQVFRSSVTGDVHCVCHDDAGGRHGLVKPLSCFDTDQQKGHQVANNLAVAILAHYCGNGVSGIPLLHYPDFVEQCIREELGMGEGYWIEAEAIEDLLVTLELEGHNGRQRT